MVHRKNPCDICGRCKVVHKTRKFVFNNSQVEEEYQERCQGCGNLLYGYIKCISKPKKGVKKDGK